MWWNVKRKLKIKTITLKNAQTSRYTFSHHIVKLVLCEVVTMRKFEIIPYITVQHIGEITVTVNLTDEEVDKCKSMSKDEFGKYIKSVATIHITDFDVDFDAETIEGWDEV